MIIRELRFGNQVIKAERALYFVLCALYFVLCSFVLFTKLKIRSPKYKAQSAKYEAQSTKYEVQSPIDRFCTTPVSRYNALTC